MEATVIKHHAQFRVLSTFRFRDGLAQHLLHKLRYSTAKPFEHMSAACCVYNENTNELWIHEGEMESTETVYL
jgi:hypothetical protein